ncbi:hypothetical protein PR001_g31345 [Phytophthora rubi]|uniref:Uncharacterized protein n=1 Tax=Phytophthora rubi TaxID=129364 RepID=A0A6A3GLI8_9STRA|nr:hypothetical protein PR001_g31345 [Phytophthora rubi]
MEGSAMDALRIAFMRQGVQEDGIRRRLREFLQGPPGHINRVDVLNSFAENRDHQQGQGPPPVPLPPAQEVQPESAVTNYTPTPRLAEPEAEAAAALQVEQQPVPADDPPQSQPTVIPDDEPDAPVSPPVSPVENEPDTTQRYVYERVVRWVYHEDSEMGAEVQWRNTIEPVSNLTPEDRLEAERQQRNRRARMRAREAQIAVVNLTGDAEA